MNKYSMMYFIILFFTPVTLAEVNETIATTDADATSELVPPCDTRCGCYKEYVYDNVQKKCVVNVTNVTERIIEYNQNLDHDILADSRLAKSIYLDGEKIFQGIIISVIFFISCAGVCVLAACIYCFRINYTDRQLHKDVKALAKKMKRDYKPRMNVPKSAPPPQPMSESCNVVVAQAGVYVV